MNPPLLHHDLKTQNILLDNEFHVKVITLGEKTFLWVFVLNNSEKSFSSVFIAVFITRSCEAWGWETQLDVWRNEASWAVKIMEEEAPALGF